MAPGAVYKRNGGGAGWNTMKNVPVPTEIKCNSCKKVKNKDAFSNKRQNDLVDKMRSSATKKESFDPTLVEYIACIGCTGQQAYERECSVCDVTKAITAFNKTQRKKDDAVCEKCMQKRLNYEPDADDSDAGDDSEDSSDASDDEPYLIDTDIESGSTAFNPTASGAGTYLKSTSGSTGGVRLSTAPSESYNTVSTSTAGPSTTVSVASTARRATATVTNVPGSKRWAKAPKAPVRKPSKPSKPEQDIDECEIADSDSDSD
ncbi:Hypothetical predicted protein [Lecanosticta acicola]|uniref:Stc1 domain-containing protein n=1 Tax=Lecanosticta acicola TaxID=111012 RepID=A0AAI8YUU8_9PEZI|nr:Hypothetical predicted protein [Lecanosticta acicola]